MASKSSLDNMLKAILAQANEEQNFSLAPYVYDSMFNTTTSLLLSRIADVYPAKTSILDICDPFVERKVIRPENGVIKLPGNYRNLLGTPMISARKDDNIECVETPRVDTEIEFQRLVLTAGCQKRPITIVDQSEFAELTTSTYKYPTLWNPIGYFSGKKEITICPHDLKAVQVMYLREEKTYRYGYIVQPDDTFIFDENTSVESEWSSAAFEPLFKALTALYAVYSRDNDMRDWSMILNEKGIL